MIVATPTPRRRTSGDRSECAAGGGIHGHPNRPTVTVNGSTSTDSDGTIASYAWNFGDGATATGAPPAHTYAVAGPYTIT